MRRVWLAVVMMLASGVGHAADTDDLRNLRIGTAAAALPAEDFSDVTCAEAPGAVLTGWRDWATCPADADGRRAVHFRYAGGETKVAGHPVLLTALFDPAGTLDGLDIETDPAAPLFVRKKAFLLGLQARARYGEDGWSCTNGTPDGTAEPVGGVFVQETCRKHVEHRDIVVSRTLLRHPGTDLKAFVDESHITLTAAPP